MKTESLNKIKIGESYLVSWISKKQMVTKKSKVLDKQGINYLLKCDNYKFCISDNDLISRRFLIKNI